MARGGINKAIVQKARQALLARGEAFVAAHWPQLTVITARVLPDNRPSLNVFRDAGFTQSACTFTRVLKDHPHD